MEWSSRGSQWSGRPGRPLAQCNVAAGLTLNTFDADDDNSVGERDESKNNIRWQTYYSFGV